MLLSVLQVAEVMAKFRYFIGCPRSMNFEANNCGHAALSKVRRLIRWQNSGQVRTRGGQSCNAPTSNKYALHSAAGQYGQSGFLLKDPDGQR
jgi:hypothetical protein